MARKIKERLRNPYIVVFWEGESEEVYMKYMEREFRDCAKIQVNKKRGLFHAAEKVFSTKGELYNVRDVIDEIWFVFDTENDLRGKWSLKQIQNEVGELADTIERNRNLFMTDRTFSNAYEGIENLKCLLNKKRSGY